MPQIDKKTVLFLDDQLDLIALYIGKIEADGYRVITASSANELRRIFSTQTVDVAILDANLLPSSEIVKIKEAQRSVGDEPYVEEEGQGFRIAAWIREHHPKTGIIVLSSERTEPSDRINGLDSGADDYAIKGMKPDEMSSRVHALLRRVSPEIKSVSLGKLHLRVEQNQLYSHEGQLIPLTAAETKLLVALSGLPHKAKSREELYWAVFNIEIPTKEDRAIDNLISKIRRKARDSLGIELPVQTVYGGGYSLVV